MSLAVNLESSYTLSVRFRSGCWHRKLYITLSPWTCTACIFSGDRSEHERSFNLLGTRCITTLGPAMMSSSNKSCIVSVSIEQSLNADDAFSMGSQSTSSHSGSAISMRMAQVGQSPPRDCCRLAFPISIVRPSRLTRPISLLYSRPKQTSQVYCSLAALESMVTLPAAFSDRVVVQ